MTPRLRARRLTWMVLASVLVAGCGDDTSSNEVCTPLQQEPCYDGPAGTEGVGSCRFGVRTCLVDGSGFSACTSEVLPAEENCGTPSDDDCDGEVNEDCACVPGSYRSCYSGPASTLNVGACRGGKQWCAVDGLSYDDCQGEVVPTTELCGNFQDDDCDGVVNQPEACACSPGDEEPCYEGPDGTLGVGICTSGIKTCVAEGGSFGPCVGQTTPEASEDCNTDEDDDCNGLVNDAAAGCSCNPGSQRSCYSGPAATKDVGACVSGTQTCDNGGNGYGDCTGDVLPQTENCTTQVDENCNGEVNELAAGCECEPGVTELCYNGPEFTLNVGTCRAGMRTCAGNAHWQPCIGEVVPTDDDCNTPLDENCDGSVNEPTSGCFCWFEDPTSLASEDCLLDLGEPAWRKPIPEMPLQIGADSFGDTFMLLGYSTPILEFEPVPNGVAAVAQVASYSPSGEFFWGKELSASVAPATGQNYTYETSVSPYGVFALTTPTVPNGSTALGSDTWDWPASAFRVLYSLDPTSGFPLFAVAVPRYQSETNTSIHAIAARDDGGVYYLNGPLSSHLHRYDLQGTLDWNVDLGLNLDDMALAATPDGGVIVAFTTNLSVTFGATTLPPIVGSSSDLVLVKFNATGTPVYVVRPFALTAVISARLEGGVLGLVAQEGFLRVDAVDGTLLSADPLPGAMIPGSTYGQIGSDGVVYGRNQADATNFGLGTVDPYGGMATGTFIALRGAGATRWSRAPLATQVTVSSGPSGTVLAAFSADTAIDLDGTVVSLMEPQVFLARLAY
ncbi:MAG: hypothetical protein U0271_24380 [Polyangiaceae bacterium]